jgi:TetR/AcrR family transcriptional regulator, transcriptional repressor for nem operon
MRDVSDVSTAILDATERRIRFGGYGGFSYREIGADVGIKSSSVHYHFPSKERLAAAVIRRYTDRVEALVNARLKNESDVERIWVELFRSTLMSDDRMCPAIVLGAAALDLPPEAAAEVKRYFEMCRTNLVDAGLSEHDADEFFSGIVGALVVANALGDRDSYDRATAGLLARRETSVKH